LATIRKHRGKWQVRVRREGVAVTKTFTGKQDAQTWARQTEAKAERRELPPDIRKLALVCTRFRGHPVKVLMEQEAGHGEATVYAGVQG
jgi:hypothetical protein